MSNTEVLKEKKGENIPDSVLDKINRLKETGELLFPPDYSPENALKSAWLILQGTKDKHGKAALEVCAGASIANTLFDMVVQGLNPVKKQCYFIVYGDQLQLQRSYMGTIAMARRFGNVTDVKANVIYDGDEFEFEIDSETGNARVTKHKQSLENFNNNIKGAYAILTTSEGKRHTEIMNIAQIQHSWQMGAAKGDSPAHKNFGEEMAKKTVINRACKMFINTSSDAVLLDNDESGYTDRAAANDKIASNANKGEIIDINDMTEIEENQTEISNDLPLSQDNTGQAKLEADF